jgi:hypothetical protein
MKLVKSLSTALIVGSAVASLAPVTSLAQQPPGTVIATGLEGPRGLRFGPDGDLYVAEAGTGGTTSTAGLCRQVPGGPAGPGPWTGGLTGRISKISRNGTVTTVASGFPSTVSVSTAGWIGVADVAFLDGTLYALVAGGGCSHGNLGHPNGIAQVNRSTGEWKLIADIGAFLKTHPAKFESADDFEPDGTLYSMIAVDDRLYTVEPNHGQVFSVTPGGRIMQIIDISASEGHIVPTSIAHRHGFFYVGNLNLFPINPQWARILTISGRRFDDDSGNGGFDDDFAPGFDNNRHGHHIVNSKAGFTTVVAVDFGPDGLLYVLELSVAPGFPTPGKGKVVRIKRSGEIENVVNDLTVPTGMTFGPDNRLYISNFGAAPPGAGQILRVDVAPGE